MSTTSGLISFTRILDGNVITCNLYSNKLLVQRMKKDAAQAIPDWSIEANQPIIYPKIVSQNSGVRINVDSFKWKYNGAEILTTDTRFQFTQMEDGALKIPGLKIVSNLISKDNMDSDTISFEGKSTINKVEYEVKANIDIRLEEMVGDPYFGFIEVTDGAVIDDNTPEVTATAILYKGGSIMKNDVTYVWNKVTPNGLEVIPNNSTNPNKQVFKSSDVESELTVKVEFKYLGETVAEYLKTISDEKDTLYLNISLSNGQDLRDGEVSVITPKVWNRVLQKEESGYKFEYSLLSSNLTPITKATGATYSMTAKTLEDNNNNINVLINATI